MAHIVHENRELLVSNNVSEIYNYRSRLTDLSSVPLIPELREPSLKTKSVQGTERKIEFGNFINSLTMTSLLSIQDEFYLSNILNEPRVIAVISTQIDRRDLYRVACVGSDRAWVCGQDKTITLVDLEGSVRDTVIKFRYNQSPPGREMPFCPGKIITDSVGRIIVADDNHCLHILDQNGRFLRCVDNCGLDRPSGVSLDSEGRLWVGSYSTGEIKVIQYRN